MGRIKRYIHMKLIDECSAAGRKIKRELTGRIRQGTPQLVAAMLSTLFWGMMAHGYAFLHHNFTHDSLDEFNGALYGNSQKLELGRVLVPAYRAVFRTDLTLPWLIGALSLLWIGLAVYLVVRTFDIRSKWQVFFTAGIFTANLTISATAATFIHDLDCDMLGLTCAAAAVYCWKTVPRWGWFLGGCFAAVSLGLYQGYISVMIVLVMIACILGLLNGERFKSIMARGLQSFAMLLTGGALYYVGMKVILRLTHVSLMKDQYNTMDVVFQLTPRTILPVIAETYRNWYMRFTTNVGVAPWPLELIRAMNLILMGIGLAVLLVGLSRKTVHWPERILCLVLTALLPLGMHILHVMTIGGTHELMLLAFWLMYLLIMLVVDWFGRYLKEQSAAGSLREVPKFICMVLIALLLHANVQTANAMYLKKDLEHDAYLSLMTRVLTRMEEFDGYVPGETNVMFVGIPEQLLDVLPGFEIYRKPNGMYMSDVTAFAFDARFERVFTYFLGNPAVFNDNIVSKKDPRVDRMPSYPSSGSMEMIDGVLVVKLGPIPDWFE